MVGIKKIKLQNKIYWSIIDKDGHFRSIHLSRICANKKSLEMKDSVVKQIEINLVEEK